MFQKSKKCCNKSTAWRCQRSAVGCLRIKSLKSKEEHGSEKKKKVELSPFIVWIALSIVNTYSGFQVNIFSNNRDITTSKFLLTADNDANTDNDNAKAIAIPWVFSENRQQARGP